MRTNGVLAGVVVIASFGLPKVEACISASLYQHSPTPQQTAATMYYWAEFNRLAGQYDMAITFFERVRHEYPGSIVAQKARSRIAAILPFVNWVDAWDPNYDGGGVQHPYIPDLPMRDFLYPADPETMVALIVEGIRLPWEVRFGDQFVHIPKPDPETLDIPFLGITVDLGHLELRQRKTEDGLAFAHCRADFLREDEIEFEEPLGGLGMTVAEQEKQFGILSGDSPTADPLGNDPVKCQGNHPLFFGEPLQLPEKVEFGMWLE